MSAIKKIFDEIAAEGGDNKKMEILRGYKDNKLLRRVLYLANSRRVKFYIKKIPAYTKYSERTSYTNSIPRLEDALDMLESIAARHYTGQDAINELTGILTNSHDGDAYIIERIIEKDCKIGMGTSNINKIFTGLIEKTPYMGAKPFDPKLVQKLFETKDNSNPIVRSDVKMDGRYCNTIIRSGEVEAESRQGEATILTGAKFLSELAQIKEDCVLNGELTMDGVSRYESNGVIASLIDIQSKRKSRTEKENIKKIEAFEKKHMKLEEALDKVRFTVWDIITVEEYFDNKSSVTCKDRFRNLLLLLEKYDLTMVSLIEHKFVYSYGQAIAHFQEVLNRGLEGTIVKALDGGWKDGKPNWQIKLKLEMDVELEITGFNYGDKGTKNEFLISSFNAKSRDGLVNTKPQGLTEDTMKFVTENQDNLLGKILTCKSCGLSQNSEGKYSMLHPVYISLRDDKDSADSLDEIIKIENMAKGLS